MRALLIWICTALASGLALGDTCVPDHPDRGQLIGHWRWVHTLDEHGEYGPAPGEETLLHLRDDGSFERKENSVVMESGNWCLRECTYEPVIQHCAGQTILSLGSCAMDGNPFCEREYRFCPGDLCNTPPGGWTEGLQLRLLNHNTEYVMFERFTVVPTEQSSWSTLKALY